jgi:subtilase family serine protease
VTDVTIPAGTPTGSYFLGAVADHQDAVPESDEGNNTLAGNAVDVVNDLPDLVVTEVTAPSSVNSGSLLSGYVQVQNQGGSSTVVGGEIAVYLSEDTVIDGSDVYLGTLPFPELSAGQIDTGTYRLGVPYDTPRGRYWVVAEVDSGGVIVESDETNNSGTAPDRTRVK